MLFLGLLSVTFVIFTRKAILINQIATHETYHDSVTDKEWNVNESKQPQRSPGEKV